MRVALCLYGLTGSVDFGYGLGEQIDPRLGHHHHLKHIIEANDNVDVFYSCHKEPTQFVKDNFDWKLFDNVGEEIIAYQQAIEYLDALKKGRSPFPTKR